MKPLNKTFHISSNMEPGRPVTWSLVERRNATLYKVHYGDLPLAQAKTKLKQLEKENQA